MAQGESAAVKELKRRLNVELDKTHLNHAEVDRLSAHIQRQERHDRGEDVMTGEPLKKKRLRSLQQRVRDRRAAEREVGLERGKP